MEVLRPFQKHRVAFSEPSSDLPTTPYEHPKKKIQKELLGDVHDMSPEAEQPAEKTVPPSGRTSAVTPLGDSGIISEKEKMKMKKNKKDTPISEVSTTSQIPALASATQLTVTTQTNRDTDTQRTTDDAVQPTKKSKKRKRADSPARLTEQTKPQSQKLPALATFDLEAPSDDHDLEDLRARKKSKKKISNLLNKTPADELVPEKTKSTPTNPTTQLSSQLIESRTDSATTQSKSESKKKSHKKEKPAVDSFEKPSDHRSSEELANDKSEDTTISKKSKKARRKSEGQPLDPPSENLASTPQPRQGILNRISSLLDLTYPHIPRTTTRGACVFTGAN